MLHLYSRLTTNADRTQTNKLLISNRYTAVKAARYFMQPQLLQASLKKRVYHRHIHQVSTPNFKVSRSVSNSALEKRKRKREQSVSGDVMHDSRKDLESRLARMEACLAETQSRLAKTEARLAELETSRKESGEEGTDRGKYGEEEVATQVGELLDDFIYSHALENMVEDLVGTYMGHLNVDVDDMFVEKENRFDETIEEVKQDVMKDCREIVLEQVKRHLAELIDTRLELSFNKKKS